MNPLYNSCSQVRCEITASRVKTRLERLLALTGPPVARPDEGAQQADDAGLGKHTNPARSEQTTPFWNAKIHEQSSQHNSMSTGVFLLRDCLWLQPVVKNSLPWSSDATAEFKAVV